jgi:outer membrane protein assembly factor BamB
MRGTRVVVMVAALVLLTSGCWLEAGQSAGRAGFNPFESQITAANVSQLGIAWQHQLTGPIRESLISPSASTAYVPSAGALTAYDLGTGTTSWSRDTTGTTTSDPVLVGGQLAVATDGTSNCQLQHLDPATGNVLSTQTFGMPNPMLCIPEPGALGTDTFVDAWRAVDLSDTGTCQIGHSARYYHGLTSVGHFNLTFFDTTTCYIGNPPAPPPATLGPAMQERNLIVLPVGENLDNVQALDASTGQPVWSVPALATVNGPVIALPNGDIAYTTTAGVLRVHDGATGKFKWSAQIVTDGPPFLTLPPAANQTTIFVAPGALEAFPVGGCNAATCNPTWTATLSSSANVRPSIGGNVVYVGSQDGTVSAFPGNGCNASTCSSLWSGATGSFVRGAPAIGQGHVVVGSQDGTVTTFALQPQS